MRYYRLQIAIALCAACLCAWVPLRAAVPTTGQAPIAMMVDLTSGQILQERSADRRFIPASITKVMTVFLAFEMIAERKLNTAQSFTIRPETHEEWYRKGSTMFLPAGEPATVDDLLMGITTISANDGAIALAEGAAGSVDAWTGMMNIKARDIGMKNSHFRTPNGWPDEGKTFVTARDLVTLADAMISRHPQMYEQYFGHNGFRYGGVAQANHDPLVGRIDGADGIKTGYTNEAGYGFLGSAKRGDRRLVMVLAGAPSEPLRDEAARRFIEWGFSNFEAREVFGAQSRIASARVQNGAQGIVGLIAPKPVRISVPSGTAPKMTMMVRYRGPLRAPIQAGQEVAYLEVAVDGMPTSLLPLVAENTVEKAGPLQRVFNGFAGWLS